MSAGVWHLRSADGHLVGLGELGCVVDISPDRDNEQAQRLGQRVWMIVGSMAVGAQVASGRPQPCERLYRVLRSMQGEAFCIRMR
jgi:hypothetical protein